MKYHHHQSLLDMTESKLAWWSAETSSTQLDFQQQLQDEESNGSDQDDSELHSGIRTSGVSRCSRCWLRWYNCYCKEYLNSRQAYYEQRWQQIAQEYQIDVEIVMFYHAAELGRSANTAHIFEHLCQSITQVIIYGDQKKEEALIQRIIDARDGKLGRPEYTCLLYPCNEAVSLNQWIDDRFPVVDSHPSPSPSSSSSISSSFALTPAVIGTRPLVRMIVLDGTYPRAKHMMKFFKACKQEFRLDDSHSLDFVQLDLDLDKGIKSAVAGVMYQPAKDKICSYQATIMAIRQLLHIMEQQQKKKNHIAGEIVSPKTGTALCKELDDDLDNWIVYILKHKIKFGKPTARKSLTEVDNELPEHLKDVVVSFSSFFFTLIYLTIYSFHYSP